MHVPKLKSDGTVRPVFPVLVFQQSKQQNRTWTTSSTVLGTPPNRTRTNKFSLEELRGGCFVGWVPKWESTENWHFHGLEPYAKLYSDTARFIRERPQKCTIVDDCAQIAESGLKPPFESPHLDIPEFIINCLSKIRSVEKGVGGQRGLSRRNPSMPDMDVFFSVSAEATSRKRLWWKYLCQGYN